MDNDLAPQIMEDNLSFVQSLIDRSSLSTGFIHEQSLPQSTLSRPNQLSKPNTRVSPSQSVLDRTTLNKIFSTPSTIGSRPQVHTNTKWFEESLSPPIHDSTHP